MQTTFTKTRLKGGSLSGTYLCTPSDGPSFVRKEVSLVKNREFGFQRWYSQLKRMQRYSVLFPGNFPKLLDYGRADDMAYFDMEYVPESSTVHEWLLTNPSESAIDQMFEALFRMMDGMYETRIASTRAPIDLYIYEEIEQKMKSCEDNARFREMASFPTVVFNGQEVAGLATMLRTLQQIARTAYSNTTETWSHGNLTLENILYQPSANRIILIDPYEENVIDSALADYSQVLQSCNSKYEIYNAAAPTIRGNRVEVSIDVYPGLEYFNDRFWKFLRERCSSDDITIIRLLEVSQFARMLPFKMEIDEDKMLFFYTLGSQLLHELEQDLYRGSL